MYEQMSLFDLLDTPSTYEKGYINVITFKDGTIDKSEYYKLEDIGQAIEKYQGEKDIYFTPNTFYREWRNTENIRQLRDIDKVENTQDTIQEIYYKVFDGLLPYPTAINFSGRGLHVYWTIENAPKQCLGLWQEIEDYFYYQLKDIGADPRATDCSRVLRLPNTINSRNNELCKTIFGNDEFIYNLYDLKTSFLRKKVYKQQNNKPKKKSNSISHIFNSYTLHMARLQDIQTLVKLRKYDIDNYRNMIIHTYAYWRGIYIRDDVLRFNSKFIVPQPEKEVKRVVKSVQKAVEKFIDYEQGIRSGIYYLGGFIMGMLTKEQIKLFNYIMEYFLRDSLVN